MKKLVLSLLTICLCCVGSFMVTGCNNEQNPSSHTHNYTEEKADTAFLKSKATCTAKAVYYKSCSCGEKGAGTFEYGETSSHSWGSSVILSGKITYTCVICGQNSEEAVEQTVTENEWAAAFNDDNFRNVTVEVQTVEGDTQSWVKLTESVVHEKNHSTRRQLLSRNLLSLRKKGSRQRLLL